MSGGSYSWAPLALSEASHPFFPDVVPEIGANPVSFYGRGIRESVTFGACFATLQNTENKANLLVQLASESWKGFQLQGALLPWFPDQALCLWTPLMAPTQISVIGRTQNKATTRQPGILCGWSGRLEQSTTGHSFGTYIVNVQKHAQDTSVLSFLLHWLTVSRVRAANIVRRPCSDSSHVIAPYKLSFLL